MSTPTISGYTTTYNCIEMRYPFMACINSLLGFCDEVIIADAGSNDGTIEAIQNLANREPRVKLFVEPVDFSHPRWAIHQDGYLKAKARARCTAEYCWQTDTDEVVCEHDFPRVRPLLTAAKHLFEKMPVMYLPMVEFWGSLDRIRGDFFTIKLRISKNDPRITHGIPAALKMYDSSGHEYPRPFDSDTCNYIWKDTGESVPTLLTMDPTGWRESLAAHEQIFNQCLDQYPSVLHVSWLDLRRKIEHYKKFWVKFHASMYNLDSADTPQKNVMFDKPWSEVTDQDIRQKAEEISIRGPRMFHSREDSPGAGRSLPFNRPIPAALRTWYELEMAKDAKALSRTFPAQSAATSNGTTTSNGQLASSSTSAAISSRSTSAAIKSPSWKDLGLAPKISVVTVSFNQGQFIRENIESVLKQGYSNFEHLIVDGGSTDSTVEVLKSYPHLHWTSEPDRGQSDALNKGFSRATGDIIGWLNSDDWYAPNIFADVAAALRDYPVVLGACAETNKTGQPQVYVPNIERNWFDLLKYWVYFSVPGQPSIFFRREVLEKIQLDPGIYIDPDLEFAMDYEFWLRVAKFCPFDRRINKTFAYSRMYDENKTDKDSKAVYRDMSQVFKRHCLAAAPTNSSLSVFLPAKQAPTNLEQTLISLAAQTSKDFEVVVASYSTDLRSARGIKRSLVELSERFQDIPLRFLHTNASDPLGCLKESLNRGLGALALVAEPGCTFEPQLVLEATNRFQRDSLGSLFPLANNPETALKLTTEFQGQRVFDINSLFSGVELPQYFVARRAALIELAETALKSDPFVTSEALVLRMLYKGWSLDINTQLGLTPASASAPGTDQELHAVLGHYRSAKLVMDLRAEHDHEPFAKVRAEHGFSLNFPDAIIDQSRKLLALAPPNWQSIKFDRFQEQIEVISETTNKYTSFSPAWFYLAKHLNERGEIPKAREAYERFQQVRSQEAALL